MRFDMMAPDGTVLDLPEAERVEFVRLCKQLSNIIDPVIPTEGGATRALNLCAALAGYTLHHVVLADHVDVVALQMAYQASMFAHDIEKSDSEVMH
jgi:hypothetical protein